MSDEMRVSVEVEQAGTLWKVRLLSASDVGSWTLAILGSEVKAEGWADRLRSAFAAIDGKQIPADLDWCKTHRSFPDHGSGLYCRRALQERTELQTPELCVIVPLFYRERTP